MDMNQELNRIEDIRNVNQADDNVIMLPIELTNATGTYLHHLNEDCLLEIFSCESLTPMDLCSLAETCKRFQQITERVFPKDYGIFRDYRGYGIRWKNHRKHYEKLQVERILKNFGSHLSKLEIDRDLDVVNLVANYCRDVTLKRLKIYDLKSLDGVRLRLDSILHRLLELHVYDSHLQVSSLDVNYDSLIELKIELSTRCDAVLKHRFPKLERFIFISDYYSFERVDATLNDILRKFIGRHGHLRAIRLQTSLICSSAFLPVINSSCKELQELTLNLLSSATIASDFHNLESLVKLKVLKLSFEYSTSYSQCIPLLQSLKSLETLKLSHMYQMPHQIFEVLSQLQNLRELHLKYCPFTSIPWTMLSRLTKLYLYGSRTELHGSDIINIIRRLVNLEELEYGGDWGYALGCSFSLREEDFSQTVKLVAGRKHVLTLKCRCRSKLVENCDENQKVKLVKLRVDSYSEDSDED